MSYLIAQIGLLVLCLWCFGVICYRQGLIAGIKRGRLDEQAYCSWRAQRYPIQAYWVNGRN